MKLYRNILRQKAQSGFALVECMVYVAVLTILVAVAIASFYVCWGGFNSMISTTDDVRAALRAGECWRADVRGASGTITVESTSSGQVVKIPENGKQIVYSFDSGALRRRVDPHGLSLLVLPIVKSSDMNEELRDGVKAWKWELELPQRLRGPHVPLLFTFESAEKPQ